MSNRVTFRFYAELKDFLAPPGGSGLVPLEVEEERLDELIEGCGVPTGEVDLIVVDSESVDLSYRVAEGDRIGVYPVFESFDITPEMRLRPEPLRTSRFLVDDGLDALCRRLWGLGFDTLPRGRRSRGEMVTTARTQRRIILTSEPAVYDLPGVTHCVVLEANDPGDQWIELVRRLQLPADVAGGE